MVAYHVGKVYSCVVNYVPKVRWQNRSAWRPTKEWFALKHENVGRDVLNEFVCWGVAALAKVLYCSICGHYDQVGLCGGDCCVGLKEPECKFPLPWDSVSVNLSW